MTVYIVDDDASVRDSLALMLGVLGYHTSVFADAEAFLSAWKPEWSGCVIVDLRLPGASGLELQRALGERGSTLPVIVITGHGDVPAARQAFRASAIDFLEKPFDQLQLRSAIDQALALEGSRREREGVQRAQLERIAALTTREREVLEQVARGLHAREVASVLGISPRTVEVHKTRIMSKLGARNTADLLRFALVAGLLTES